MSDNFFMKANSDAHFDDVFDGSQKGEPQVNSGANHIDALTQALLRSLALAEQQKYKMRDNFSKKVMHWLTAQLVFSDVIVAAFSLFIFVVMFRYGTRENITQIVNLTGTFYKWFVADVVIEFIVLFTIMVKWGFATDIPNTISSLKSRKKGNLKDGTNSGI